MTQELNETREALASEQGKVFKLEVQLAEANQKMQQVTDLEKELNQYRQVPTVEWPAPGQTPVPNQQIPSIARGYFTHRILPQ